MVRVRVCDQHLRQRPSYTPNRAVEQQLTPVLRIADFLAAFSGLYFTVYAVTDDVYRKQFFSNVIRELERAVSARVAYRSLKDGGVTPP